MKKLFALLLAVVLVLGLVACAQPAKPTDPKPTDPKPTDPKPTTPNTTAKPTEPEVSVTFPLEEELTLTLLTPFPTNVTNFKATLENNKTWQDLYKKTNIKINVVDLPDLDTLNAYMQMGSYGDIISVYGVKDLASNEAAFAQLISSNRLYDLNEFIDNPKVMPNIQKALEGLPTARGKWTSPDGGLYMFGSMNAERSTYLESSCWINKTWLEKANMTVADVATIEGLEKFFDWIMKNDPNGNGEQDELPYFCYPSGGAMIEALLGLYGMPTKDASNENYITLNSDYEVEFVPQTDAYKDWLTMLNKWYTEGWMYQDYLLGTGDANYAKAYDKYMRNNGQPDRIGFYTGNSQPARVTSSGDKDLHPNKDAKCEYISILPPTVEGYDVRWYMHPGFLGVSGYCAIASNSEHPAEAAAWIDLFYTDAMATDITFGAEGSEWRVVDKDGKISKLSGLNPEAENELLNVKLDAPLATLVRALPSYVSENALLNIRTTTAAVQAKRDALAFYQDAGVLNPDAQIWPRHMIAAEISEQLGEIRGDLMTLVETYRADAISGKKNLTTDWDAFQKALKNDVKTAEFVELLQESIDVYWEAMGIK